MVYGVVEVVAGGCGYGEQSEPDGWLQLRELRRWVPHSTVYRRLRNPCPGSWLLMHFVLLSTLACEPSAKSTDTPYMEYVGKKEALVAGCYVHSVSGEGLQDERRSRRGPVWSRREIPLRRISSAGENHEFKAGWT